MAYIKPDDVVAKMIEAAVAKGRIPVTFGNLVGGFLFTGLALYATHHRTAPATRELLSETAPPRILNEQLGTAQE